MAAMKQFLPRVLRAMGSLIAVVVARLVGLYRTGAEQNDNDQTN